MASKNSMEQTIQTLKGDNEELMKENASLKKQISGFKTSNANYKKQIAHLKQLDKEGDELNEKRIAEMDVMQKNHLAEVKQLGQSIKEKDEKIAEKDKVVNGLQEQVRELIQKKNKLEAEAAANKDYITELEATVEDLRKPWWKKIFR
jgi:chromosome segregation ATPase